MRKIVLGILLSLVCVCSVFSQYDAQVSQYMFRQSSFNPAAVGEDELIQVSGLRRFQWLGMPNAGRTTMFSINSPVKIGSKYHGVGIKFLKEKIGQFTNEYAHLQFAYKKRLGTGLFSVGTDLGYVSVGFNAGDSIHKISIGDYHFLNGEDPLIPKTNVAGMSFDMAIGVYYSTKEMYAGISYTHLNSPTVSWSDNIDFSPVGSLYCTGGYNWVLPNPKFEIKPSALFKTDFKSLQLDLSSRLEYDHKYWGGLSYRIQDAVVIMAGINLEGGLSIGYSYDLPTSKIITVSSGSHEVSLAYSFEYVFGKRSNKYKSIRIL